MDADEFLRLVKPASLVPKSRLSPLEKDLLKLRDAGCSLKQLHQFVEFNGVKISFDGLAKYMRRRCGLRTCTDPLASTSGTRKASQAPSAPAAEEAKETTVAGSHNPATLDAIISSKPDLAALERMGKSFRKQKR